MDPFEGYVDAPETLHPYLYAGDDPVGARDPSGRDFGDTFDLSVQVAVPSVTLPGRAPTGLSFSDYFKTANAQNFAIFDSLFVSASLTPDLTRAWFLKS